MLTRNAVAQKKILRSNFRFFSPPFLVIVEFVERVKVIYFHVESYQCRKSTRYIFRFFMLSMNVLHDKKHQEKSEPLHLNLGKHNNFLSKNYG